MAFCQNYLVQNQAFDGLFFPYIFHVAQGHRIWHYRSFRETRREGLGLAVCMKILHQVTQETG